MPSIFVSFVALYLAVFLLMAGIGLLGTYLPLRLTVDGVSTQLIGFVTSAYFLGMCVGALYCCRLIRGVGHIRAFAAFAAITTSLVLLHGLFISPLLWGLLRFFAGLSTIGLYTVIESWLNECTVPASRGKVMSVYMVVSYLGMGGGQALLNLGSIQDPRMFFIISLLLMLCIVPVVVTRSIHPELPDFGRFNIMKMIRKAPVGMLGCFLAGLLIGAFYSIVPVFCHTVGLPVTSVSTVMIVSMFGGLVLQWPVGALSDRYDRTYMLSLISVAVSVTSVLIFLTTDYSFTLFLVLMGLFGGLIFTIYPVSVARAHDLFKPAEAVPASSALLLCYCIGAAAGPIAATFTMITMKTAYGLFAYCSLVSLVSAIIIFYLRKRECITIVSAEDSSTFVPMKSTSRAAVLLDPRIQMKDDPGSAK